MAMVAKFTDDSEVVNAVRNYWENDDCEYGEVMMTREEFYDFTMENVEDIFNLPCEAKVDLTASQVRKSYEVYRDIVTPLFEKQSKKIELIEKIARLLVEYNIYSEIDIGSALNDAEELISNY